MVNIRQLQQLIAKHNKAFKIMGVWKMNREQLLKAIDDNGYEVVDREKRIELRPKGAKSHFRKKVQKVPKTKGQIKQMKSKNYYETMNAEFIKK